MSENLNGRLIAFMGLPGSGKSTIARALAAHIGGDVFLEPEEEAWPAAVKDRHKCGYYTAISWFRSVRVPQLIAANAIRSSGGIAVLDSYYDKLLAHYIHEPLMAWLIPPDDPYFEHVANLALTDSKLLPNVDILVFLKLSEAIWMEFLSVRGRALDGEVALVRSFPTQEAFLKAAATFCEASGAKLVVLENDRRDVSLLVNELTQKLIYD